MSPIHERVGHCVALYRKPTYSPQQHLANDAAIMDSVVQSLEQTKEGVRLKSPKTHRGRRSIVLPAITVEA